MSKNNAKNERIKRQYFSYLKEAKRHSDHTVDAAANALHRFEIYTKHRDFKTFHIEQAIGFKRHLAEQKSSRSGKMLSKATLYSTLMPLKQFFQWLAWQPGYKSSIQYSDAEYFNLSDKDTRIATARREQRAPTIEQIKHVLQTMPRRTEIERRNRAVVAFALLTGARDGAIVTMKLKHLDLIEGFVFQDAREVRTKFSKTFKTYFFPVGHEITQILEEWVSFLKEDRLWGNDDPLFPSTLVGRGSDHQFGVVGLDRAHWSSASPLRRIFREAFERAGLPYFNPHSFRNTLVRFGHGVCKTPEDLKAWSQNLGHEDVLTTLMNYGTVADDRQAEILKNLTKPRPIRPDADKIVRAVVEILRGSGSDDSSSD